MGTTKCKCLLLSEKGEICAISSADCKLLYTPDGIEQDANGWWDDAVLAIRRLLDASGAAPKDIVAMSVSSQAIAGVPVNGKSETLYNALSWLDARSGAEVESLVGEFGISRLFEWTGKFANSYSFPQLMWIKKNLPQVYAKTSKYLHPLDYLNMKLTGKAVTDYSMASGTYAFDISRHRWVSDLFSFAGIPDSLYADVACVGTPIGNLTREAGEQTGLSTDTLVFLGAHDQRCASIGASIGPGVSTISLGTAAAVSSLVDRPILDSSSGVTCNALTKEHWILESVIFTACAALDWAKEMFFPDNSLAELDAMAASAPPGASGAVFIPNLAENDARGGALSGLSLKTTRAEIARAILEGIALQLSGHIANQEALVGKIEKIMLFGGGASSSCWCQIIADICKKTVTIPQSKEAAAFGAAVIAGVGAGFWKTYSDACQSKSKTVYHPGSKEGN